jgi:hypothetical protein
MVRKLYLFLFFHFFLSFYSQAQIAITLNLPDTIGACRQNPFEMIIVNGSGSGDTVSIASTITPPGTSDCAPISQGLDYSLVTPLPTGMTVLSHDDSLVFVIPTGFNDTLEYLLFLDCHLIPDSLNTTITLTHFFDADTVVTVNGSGASIVLNNILFPYLIELNSGQNMNSQYLTNFPFTFYYLNSGLIPANILFQFENDPDEYCSQIETDSITFQIGINGTSSIFTSSIPVLLNPSDTLIIQQHNRQLSCLVTCPVNTATFSYTCNYDSLTLTSFCEACQNEYLHSYTVNNRDTLSIDVIRITPADPIYDFSCMNDTAGVWWEYQIVNNGAGAIDTLQFHLTQDASISGSINFLSLLPISSIAINRNGGYLDTLITPKSQWLCTNLVSDALYSMKVVATDFMKNDTLFMRFKTIRCSEETDSLLDMPKFYNQWSMDSIYLVSVCGRQRLLGQTGDLLTANNYFAGQAVGSNYDVNLLTSFFPSVSDLTVSNANIGQNAWFNIDLRSALSTKQNVYQLLGCNGQNATCDTLFGWLRAQIQTDTNLHVIAPSLDVFLQKVDIITGDTVQIAADWWYSGFDTTLCTNHTYNYYFNLNRPLMRNFLDSGSFVFNLTSCCATDASPTPYNVEFYLLAAPSQSCVSVTIPSNHSSTLIINDTTQQWLPLSDEGSGISVHCPGCLAPGIIVDYYNMQRNSFGLQDTDNDGRADSLNAVIDPSGSWFAANKNKLNTNFSGFGDRVEDLLTAHLQAGDPGSGGYSYLQMQQSPLNLRFNALQVGREIPMGLDTMLMLPDSLIFYVDTPMTTVGGCFECDDFGLNPGSFKTQLKIVATGADIFNHFLDTITASNLYLFSFVDTVGGNLNSGAFDTSIPGGNSFNGFFEGQYYRLRVTYNVCGNFTGGIGTDVEDFVKRTDVLNRMWVSGKVQTSSSVPQMYNDINLLHDSLSIGVSPSDTLLGYSLMDTSYVNNYLFYCETRGSMHYFMSNDATNGSSIVNTPGCKKDMQLYASSKIAGGKSMFDAYPYEYRPPAIGLTSANLIIPADYYVSKASSRNIINFNNLNQDTDSIGIQLSDTTGNIFIDGSTLPLLQCLTQSVNPNTGQTPHAGDQLNIRVIDLELLPLNCDPSTAMPPDSSVITNFDLQIYPCLSLATCSLPDSISLKAKPTAITALSNNPQLSLTQDDNSVQIEGDTICWNVSLTNSSVSGTTLANNVFFAINDPDVSGVLSGWHFYPTGSGVPNVLDGVIVPVITSLAPGAAIGGNLCAAVTDCPVNDSLTFGLYFGWNCGGYPQAPFDTLALCEIQTDSLRMNVIIGQLFSSGKTYETPYKLCDTISFTTCFQNFNEGNLFPQQLVLDSIVDGIDIISGTMSNGTLSVQLTATVNDSLWLIHPDSIALLYPSGGFNVTSSDFCVTMTASLGCNFAGSTVLPNKTLYVTNVCGRLDSLPVAYTTLGQFYWDTTSYCTDCFTLDKFSNDTLVATGDPVTYQVVACNYNATSNTVALVDLLPSGFIPTTNLPATTTLLPMECDTFAVTGTFFLSGGCPAMTNNAFLIFNGDTTAASACVEVISSSAICQDSADTIWTGTVNSNQLATTFSNTTIYIADSLVVTDTLRFLECQIIMAAGSSIHVRDSGRLFILESTVMGCDTMWQGIYVNELGRLTISESSLVADANIAVTARHKSVVSITHSNLMDNARNVFIPVTSGVATNNVSLTMFGDSIGVQKNQFLPRYSGQAAFGSIPMSGVETNRWVGTIGTTGLEKNVFFNMMRGIVGKVSSITCENNDFIDMVKDITAPSNLSDHGKGITMASDSLQTASNLHVKANNYFYNNLYGIYTSRCNTTVRGVLMDTVRYGVHMRNSYLSTVADISTNTINAYFRGIDLLNNAGSGGISVRENTININAGASAPRGISMSETTFGKSNYKIENNFLTLNGADHGIIANAVAAPLITGNIINQNPLTAPNSSSGITINGCDSAIVSCNTITSTYNMAQNLATGIRVDISPANYISCNNTDGHHIGIFFGGNCPATNFAGNDLWDHNLGLNLNGSAVIDTQTHAGNRWLGTYTNFGAVNNNAAIVSDLYKNLFIVNSSAGSGYIPSFPSASPDNTGWFDLVGSGTTYLCDTTCPEASRLDGGSEELRQLVAKDSIITTEFIPESKIIARQHLYEELKTDPSLILSNTTLHAFQVNNQFTSIGYLSNARNFFNQSTQLDATIANDLSQTSASISAINHQIFAFDSLIAFQPTHELLQERNIAIQALEAELSVQSNLINLHANPIVTLYQQARNNNNLVVPVGIPDANEKYINYIILKFQEGGFENITSDFVGILNLAQQCPYSGGKAVYVARTFVSLFDDEVSYDDKTTCEVLGFLRTQNLTENHNVNSNFQIQPNPAFSFIDIIFDTQYAPTIKLKLTILDNKGSVVLYAEHNSSNTLFRVDTSKLNSGVYAVQLQGADLHYKTQKLILLK